MSGVVVHDNYSASAFGGENMVGFVVHLDGDAYGFVPVSERESSEK